MHYYSIGEFYKEIQSGLKYLDDELRIRISYSLAISSGKLPLSIITPAVESCSQ